MIQTILFYHKKIPKKLLFYYQIGITKLQTTEKINVKSKLQMCLTQNLDFVFANLFQRCWQISTCWQKLFQNIPWDKVNIRALLIEVAHMGELFEGSLKDLEDFLASKNYKLHKSIEIDNIYIRNDFAMIP